MNKSICSLMLKEHERTNKLLEDFEKALELNYGKTNSNLKVEEIASQSTVFPSSPNPKQTPNSSVEYKSKGFGDLENSKKLFSAFKWNLEKHFFIEEKVIFSIYNISAEEGIEEEKSDMFILLKDHKDMLWIIKTIEESLEDNLLPDLTELKNILKSHVSLEDETFYPRLDTELDEEQKSLIFERADEIIRE